MLLKNVYFDTCVYHLPGIELLTKVIPADNILFASEMVGAVRGIDPRTGHHYDDTKRYIDAGPRSPPKTSTRSSRATPARSTAVSASGSPHGLRLSVLFGKAATRHAEKRASSNPGYLASPTYPNRKSGGYWIARSSRATT